MGTVTKRSPTANDWAALELSPPDGPITMAVDNEKGGSGKTTSAVSLSTVFAKWGLKVRLTDGDPQAGSATYWLPPQITGGYLTLADVFTGAATLSEATYPTPVEGVWIVPSLKSLKQIEHERPAGSDTLIANEIASDPRFDLEMFDAAAATGIVTVSLLSAARHIIITMKAGGMDYVGAMEINDSLTLIKKRLNPDLTLSVVAIVDCDGNTIMARQMTEQAATEYAGAMIAQVPHSTRASEAPNAHESLITYAPDNPVTIAYYTLAARMVPVLGLTWKTGPADMEEVEWPKDVQ